MRYEDLKKIAETPHLMEHLWKPKYSYDFMEKAEYTTKLHLLMENKNVTEKTRQELQDLYVWIAKIWDMGSTKENHCGWLTQINQLLIAENAKLKSDVEKLNSLVESLG